jgi:hypothetical protein
LTDVTRRHAHAFQLELSDAIDAVTVRAPEGRFAWRGADLRFAAARSLWVSASNDAALQAAHAQGGGAVAGSALEAELARRLLGDAKVRAPGRLRRARAALLTDRQLRREAPSPSPAGGPRGGVWFALDHAKFLALIAPIAAALGQDCARVLWATGCPRPSERAGDPELAPVLAAPAPRLRDAGAGLRALSGLLAGYDRARAALERLAPETVVVVEGNSPFDGLIAAAARSLAIPVVGVQNGWSPIVHAGFRHLPFDRMCVWGDGFAQLLAPYNPGLELVACGHPTLRDGAAAARPSPLASAVGGRPALGVFLQSHSPYIGSAQLDAFLALVAEVARAAPDAAIVVREHPQAPIGDRAWPGNVLRADAPQHTLGDVLAVTRAVLSIYSTSLLEGAALGRPAVSLNQTALPRLSPDLAGAGAGVESADAASVRDALLELLADPDAVARYRPGMATVRERYVAGLPADGAQRIAAAVRS